MKFSFLQKWGTYTNETLVVVGMNGDEIVKVMRRMDFKDCFVRKFHEERVELDKSWFTNSKSLGVTWRYEGATVIWFPDWKRDWAHYNTLVHELYHAVHYVMHDLKGMRDEEEGCAYQLEFLFDSIRRKLDKAFIKKVKKGKAKKLAPSRRGRK